MKLPISLVLLAGVAGVALAGCGGSSPTNPINPNTGKGYFRFVNGSADSGAVDVYINNTKINTSPVGYGGMTAYYGFGPGAFTISVDATGTSTPIAGIASSSLKQSVNGGQYVSLVLVGEQHPTVSSDTPNLLAFDDATYSTPTNGFAINFHNAAVITGTSATQLTAASATTTQSVGNSVVVGNETGPTGIQSSLVGTNATVTFTATPANTSVAAVSATPSDFDSSGCAANTLPCNSGNLSLYFIDGPAASSSPSAGPYPNGITASQVATFTGIFDANGT
jgi:hypothetical protein